VVIEYIRYTIPPEQGGAFERAYNEAGRSLSASSYCRSYELARCVEEPTSYVVRIEWDSLEGHEQGFRSSPEFRSFFALVRPYADAIEEMRHYEAFAGATP
jgi:heme-degrading monooxygenase HmoA